MENTKQPRELTLEDMEKYVCEWLADPKIEIAKVVGHDTEEAYTISQGETVEYLTIFKKGECKRDSIVTTAGVINDELRGCIEQCIDLDRQLEELRKQRASQKGE